MTNQLINNAEALRLFFNEDIYLVKNENESDLLEKTLPIADDSEVEIMSLPAEAIVINVQEPIETLNPQKPTITPQTDFKYLGKNQKNILILVNDQQHEVSTEQGRELLRKLVNAISLTAKDFALVNYADYENTTFSVLMERFACKMVLAFGVSAKQLSLAEQPLHQLTSIDDVKFIFTTNLHDLESNQGDKKVLWTSLQQLL